MKVNNRIQRSLLDGAIWKPKCSLVQCTAANSTNHDTPFFEKEYSGVSIVYAVPTRGVGSKNNGVVGRGVGSNAWFGFDFFVNSVRNKQYQ